MLGKWAVMHLCVKDIDITSGTTTFRLYCGIVPTKWYYFFYETYLGPLDFLLPKTIIYFRIESTWWRLYQKRVVHNNLDIDVFITNIISLCKGNLVVNDFDQNICI